MSIPIPKVEIGFDLQEASNFFKLDDSLRGELNSSYVLAGEIFYDVTAYLISISIDRGKNREVDVYDPGLANVVLQNRQRIFDPLFTASPFYGQIIPKRATSSRRASVNLNYLILKVSLNIGSRQNVAGTKNFAA